MKNDFLLGNTLFRDVGIYNGMGHHRTGGDGETQTNNWIATELKIAGLEVSFQEFTTRQFFVRESKLLIGNTTIACFPYWFPCASVSGRVNGKLTAYGAQETPYKDKIVVYRNTSSLRSRRESESLINNLSGTGALAVILISNTPSGEIALINSPHDALPWPIPVVFVGKKDEITLQMALDQQNEITLLFNGEYRNNTRTNNIFGRWGGNDDIIVVSTPKSGWFNCGGERGSGVALALGIARWIGERKTSIAYWLDFNTGHELNYLGTRHFLSEKAPRPEKVKAWVHLGANIATWDFKNTPQGILRHANPARYPVVCSNNDFLSVAKQAIIDIPRVKPYVGEGIGEFGPVIREGYRGFGIYGGDYFYFHTPADGPHGTAPELLEPVMNSLVTALTIIEKM